jgi:putative peptide zinc metalloprotease protein
LSAKTFESINFDAIDIAHQKLRLIDDLSVWPVWENGRRIYRLERRDAKRFYRVGFREYTFVSLLDGKTTVAAACGLSASKLGTDALTNDESESIVIWLIEEGIAVLAADSSGDQIHAEFDAGHQTSKTGLLQRLNPFWIQIPLIKDAATMNRLSPVVSKCFHPLVVVPGVVLIVCGMVAFGLNRESVYASSSDLFSRNGWVSLLLTWIVLKIIHEAGHAVACHRAGGETSEFGIVLVLFAPLAYVDVSSCWRMSRRSSRLCVSAAGMYVELLVAACAMFVWLMTDDITTKFYLANVIVVAGVATLIFNANPLMRFDGYYLLSDAIGIPNLYTESGLEWKRIRRRFFYGERSGGSHYRGFRRVFLIGYGCLAAIWRVFICLVLCVSAAVIFSGAGIVIAFLGVVVWFGKPAWSMITECFENQSVDTIRFVRSVILASGVTGLISATLFVPVSTSVKIDGVVQDPPESIIRASSDGFVSQIHVLDGQSVIAGQKLLTMENRTLQQEVTQLRFSLQENAVMHRIATDRHDASAESSLEQDRIAVERKLEQIQPKAQALTILAPHSGTVARRELNVLMGQYVREGEELVRVVGNAPPEVIGVAHQDQIAAVRKMTGHSIRICDAGNHCYDGRLRTIDPRASNELPDRSLAASYGGPLDVTGQDAGSDVENDPSPIRLIDPHFVLRVEIAERAVAEMKSGMRVRMDVGHRRESLWQRGTMAFRSFYHRMMTDSET